MGRVQDQIVIVTGAAHGQGRAHALEFAKEGAHVVVVDICENIPTTSYPLGTWEELNEVVELIKEMGREALPVKCDIRKDDQVQNMVKQTIDKFGRVDVLINNAAVCGFGWAWEIPEQTWVDMIDVNINGMWRCCKHVIPHMIKQKSGRILNTASMACVRYGPTLPHYNTSKTAVVGLTKSLAIELAPYNITVNSVAPGTINTPQIAGLAEELGMAREAMVQQWENNTFLLDTHIPPEDISQAYLYLASHAARNVTGIVLHVDAGATTHP